MSRSERLGMLVTVSLLAFALAYHWQPPGPLYVPLERRWSWGSVAGVVAMKWYARNLGAVAATLVAAGVAWLVSGRCPRAWSDRAQRVGTGLTVLAWLALLVRLAITELGPWAIRSRG